MIGSVLTCSRTKARAWSLDHAHDTGVEEARMCAWLGASAAIAIYPVVPSALGKYYSIMRVSGSRHCAMNHALTASTTSPDSQRSVSWNLRNGVGVTLMRLRRALPLAPRRLIGADSIAARAALWLASRDSLEQGRLREGYP